ncbi:MAG: phosphoadenylyl-sulfate reductase [Oligoflexus sp.]
MSSMTKSMARYDARPKAKQSELYEERWTVPQIENLNDLMCHDRPEDILLWAEENFSPKLKFSCQFSMEDVVLLHLMHRLGVQAEVFFLDTGRLHQETYDLVETYREQFHFDINVYTPDTQGLAGILSKNGVNPFYRNRQARQECCFVRKMEPMARALDGADAWVSGQRQEYVTNATGVVAIDSLHGGILQINPIYYWDSAAVWEYVRQHQIPYNRLYDQGFASVGCSPCNRPLHEGESVADGTWWWEDAKENDLPVLKNSEVHRVG